MKDELTTLTKKIENTLRLVEKLQNANNKCKYDNYRMHNEDFEKIKVKLQR